MNKTLYQVNWSTEEIETAVLLDENNLNEGALRETWLCIDSSGRKFSCSKGSWQFSELAAWQEYQAELEENERAVFEALLDAQNCYEEATNALLSAKQKVQNLKDAQNKN